MAKFFVAAACVLVAASLAVAACGDEYEESPMNTPAQGAVDGACYPNSTCNVGLSCAVVEGQAKCRPAGASDASSSSGDGRVDIPTDKSDATTDALVDGAGAPVCSFQATAFPCGIVVPPLACYGATQHCTATNCNGDEARWECFSTKDCKTPACCLAAKKSANTQDCGKHELGLDSSVTGTRCDVACKEENEVRLCRSNVDCQAGATCQPFTLKGGAASLAEVIVGVCLDSN